MIPINSLVSQSDFGGILVCPLFLIIDVDISLCLQVIALQFVSFWLQEQLDLFTLRATPDITSLSKSIIPVAVHRDMAP